MFKVYICTQILSGMWLKLNQNFKNHAQYKIALFLHLKVEANKKDALSEKVEKLESQNITFKSRIMDNTLTILVGIIFMNIYFKFLDLALNLGHLVTIYFSVSILQGPTKKPLSVTWTPCLNIFTFIITITPIV